MLLCEWMGRWQGEQMKGEKKKKMVRHYNVVTQSETSSHPARYYIAAAACRMYERNSSVWLDPSVCIIYSSIMQDYTTYITMRVYKDIVILYLRHHEWNKTRTRKHPRLKRIWCVVIKWWCTPGQHLWISNLLYLHEHQRQFILLRFSPYGTCLEFLPWCDDTLKPSDGVYINLNADII